MRVVKGVCTGVVVVVTLAAAGCALTSAGGGDGQARRLGFPEPTWFEAGIDTDDAERPGFTIRLKADMPTPGYDLTVDEVAVDDEARRIVARVTERAPSGMVAQVITSATLAIEVGPLAPGAWVFELRTRRDPSGAHVPRHARVLQAY